MAKLRIKVLLIRRRARAAKSSRLRSAVPTNEDEPPCAAAMAAIWTWALGAKHPFWQITLSHCPVLHTVRQAWSKASAGMPLPMLRYLFSLKKVYFALVQSRLPGWSVNLRYSRFSSNVKPVSSPSPFQFLRMWYWPLRWIVRPLWDTLATSCHCPCSNI